MNNSNQEMKKKDLYVVFAVIAVLVVGMLSFGLRQDTSTATENATSVAANDSPHDDTMHDTNVPIEQPTVILSTNDTETNLLYLIEEEKLAHDVYTKMYELYGSKVFSNISSSETRHQSLVATVMETYKIEDPRSSDLGVFTNQDLQKLYNDLVARGSKSLTDAYQVGVTIEEMDIADLRSDLAALAPEQTDVKSTLEILLRGSENHLRAFNRKLG